MIPSKRAKKAGGARSRMMVLVSQVKTLWAQACREDKIPENATVAAFSETNQFAKAYNKAIQDLFQARQQFAASLA